MQIIFQDSVGSLDPRMRSRSSSARGSRSTASARARSATTACVEVLERVGLRRRARRAATRTSSSGGQRQRIGIARALVLQPKLVVADEPVSALDVSIQSQVLNLLVELKQEFGLTYLFVAHDLAVVGYIADRIAVMYLGKIVELAPRRRALRAAAPSVHAWRCSSAIPEPRAGPQAAADRAHRRRAEPDRTRRAAAASARAARSRRRSARRSSRRSSRHGAGHLAACHFAGTPIPGPRAPPALRRPAAPRPTSGCCTTSASRRATGSRSRPTSTSRSARGALPTIVQWTPYESTRERFIAWGVWFAQRGYAAVVVDCRGRYESGRDVHRVGARRRRRARHADLGGRRSSGQRADRHVGPQLRRARAVAARAPRPPEPRSASRRR